MISDCAGGFEPLRYLPKGNKVVVVGVITSKFGELENKDDVKRRLEEAAKFVLLDQLAVSPQCGFASTEEGNILSEEEQWAKLRLAVEVAEEVWKSEAVIASEANNPQRGAKGWIASSQVLLAMTWRGFGFIHSDRSSPGLTLRYAHISTRPLAARSIL